MGRAPCCDKANVKRGPWSPEEDATLRSYVQKNGTGGNWIALPQKAGLKRCGKSCRLRWLNYLRPDIKHGGFTDEEDGIICSLYRSLGSRWSVIASRLPGRTDNDVKNYWNTKLKKKLMSAKHSAPPPPPPATSAGPSLLPPLPCPEPLAGPAFWPAPAYFSSPTLTEDASLAASSLTTDGSSGGGGLWAAENDAMALMDAASDALDWSLQSWIETPAPFFPGAWAAAGAACGLPELYENISYT